jgi:predicted amidohydrolase
MPTIRAAVVQTSPVFGDVAGNLSRALRLVPEDCDLAVLPELFATGYQFVSRDEARELAEDPRDGPVTAALREFATSRATTLVAGLAEREGDRVFNSAILVRDDGSWEIYRKTHLFWDESLVFTPGDRGFPVFPACGTTLGVMICYDWVYPEAARTLALRGATVICHPSNLVLPYCPDAMLTRSLENRVYTITANRVGSEARTEQQLTFIGRSQIVSPAAERLATCGCEEEAAAVAEIDTASTTKELTPRNHLWRDRRPELYES